jgi:hypothetical protein
MEQLNLANKSELLGYFYFQQFNLYLGYDGTAQPVAPEVNCWDTSFQQFNLYRIMMEPHNAC